MTEIESFDALYEEARSGLVAQMYLFTGDEAEAADLVQLAFERAWTHWSRVSQMANPEAWVRLVAYNFAKNHRRMQRSTEIHATMVPCYVPDEIEREQALIELNEALQRLSANQRQALILHYYVGLSVSETATAMSTRPGTVMSWLHRARTILAAVMTDVEVAPRSAGRGNDA